MLEGVISICALSATAVGILATRRYWQLHPIVDSIVWVLMAVLVGLVGKVIVWTVDEQRFIERQRSIERACMNQTTYEKRAICFRSLRRRP